MPDRIETRQVWFGDSEEPQDTPVYRRDDLTPGMAFTGPAVVEQLDATTLVPPGVDAMVDRTGTIHLTISEED